MSRPIPGEPYVKGFQLSRLSAEDRKWIEEEYRPIADFAEAVAVWIDENTGLDPARSRMKVLDLMLWLEREAEHPSHKGRSLLELLRLTSAVSSGNERWLRGKRVTKSGVGRGRMRDKTPEELRAHLIGKSQTRGDRNGPARWWYAVPPEPAASVEVLGL